LSNQNIRAINKDSHREVHEGEHNALNLVVMRYIMVKVVNGED